MWMSRGFQEIEFVAYKFWYVRTNQDPVRIELATNSRGANLVSFQGRAFHGEWAVNDDFELYLNFHHNPDELTKLRRPGPFKRLGSHGVAASVWRYKAANPEWSVILIAIEDPAIAIEEPGATPASA